MTAALSTTYDERAQALDASHRRTISRGGAGAARLPVLAGLSQSVKAKAVEVNELADAWDTAYTAAEEARRELQDFIEGDNGQTLLVAAVESGEPMPDVAAIRGGLEMRATTARQQADAILSVNWRRLHDALPSYGDEIGAVEVALAGKMDKRLGDLHDLVSRAIAQSVKDRRLAADLSWSRFPVAGVPAAVPTEIERALLVALDLIDTERVAL